jgi:hypothetical protein
MFPESNCICHAAGPGVAWRICDSSQYDHRGHFAAMKNPQQFVAHLWATFRAMR